MDTPQKSVIFGFRLEHPLRTEEKVANDIQ